jgi:glycosyltransferase involved in cell wall biosynthesis
MNPSVSIVVTTYNQGRFIEETILSALNQQYVDREIVVVDDGSSDDTPERLHKFRDQIVYIRQENRGVAESRNTGVRVARGKLIAFLDGDDLWDPEKIAIQVATYEKYPHAGAVVTDSCIFDGERELHSSTLLWGRGFFDSPAP